MKKHDFTLFWPCLASFSPLRGLCSTPLFRAAGGSIRHSILRHPLPGLYAVWDRDWKMDQSPVAQRPEGVQIPEKSTTPTPSPLRTTLPNIQAPTTDNRRGKRDSLPRLFVLLRNSAFLPQRKGFPVNVQRLGRHIGLQGGLPGLRGDVGEIMGEPAHQHDVHRLGGACLLGQREAVHGIHLDALGLHLLHQVFG